MKLFAYKKDSWNIVGLVVLGLFVLFLLYPLVTLLVQAFIVDGSFSLEKFQKFFSSKYYTNTIGNSFKLSICITILSLIVGIPLSYFYSFYKMKGSKIIFISSVLCSMSAPFIGAYSWIMLLGRNGSITVFLKSLGINIGSIYGFGGMLLVQVFKFFPLVFIYMNGAFKNIDNSLMEASANMGCVGFKRLMTVVLKLVMPTILASSLMVFMRAFADFGTPALLGEGYMTFPLLIYREFVGDNGTDHSFAAAISLIAVVITALVFFIQKWATSKYKFSLNAMHSVEKKDPKGLSGVLMHVYSYLLIAFAILPQIYIIYLSFRNCKTSVFLPGYSLGNYKAATRKLLGRSIFNTMYFGVVSLVLIIIFAIIIAYLVVRRSSLLSNSIDTLAMLPYIMPGAVIGIMLIIGFGKAPFFLTGTMAIMVISLVIRRMPYTIRSATATLQQISMSVEEASISLGASKFKTLTRITVPMMANGIISGAILSWVSIVTELSSAILLYNNKSITLTMSAYAAISRGNDGLACAFSAILTVVTIISLIVYLAVNKSEDVKL